MLNYYAKLSSFGSCVPQKILNNYDLEKIVETSDEWIRTRTGMFERHIASENEAASDLAYEAAVRAIESSSVKYKDIDQIIVATISGDHPFPSTACILQKKLGLKDIPCFDISAGCTGFIYALDVARQYVENGIVQNILVIGVEILTKITNWKDRNTCVLFGDGAGAAVIGEVEDGLGVLGIDLGSDGSGGKYLFQPAGGSRRPASHETVDAREHFIHMNGNEVFKFAIQIMGKTAKRALAKAGLEPADVDLLVPHQANIRIINSAAKRLKMPMEKVWVNVDKYGNTSAASIPIALCEAQEQGVLKKGGTVLLVGFGAGLTWSSIVLKWSK